MVMELVSGYAVQSDGRVAFLTASPSFKERR